MKQVKKEASREEIVLCNECGQRIEPNSDGICLDCRFEAAFVCGDNFPIFSTESETKEE